MQDNATFRFTFLLLCAAILIGVSYSIAAPPQSGVSSSAQMPPAAAPSAPVDESHLESLKQAAVRLPLAAVLAAGLAFRPRRKGTPERKAPVIQTQIILGIVGAVVMLVVGASLARAFGIVGAASLIRYRAKIDDPKDAGVMLTTLSVGLASGVGLYLLATFTMVFVLGALWIIESFEPEAHKVFNLKIKLKNPVSARDPIEATMRRHRVAYELRTSSQEELAYEVKVPLERKVDSISSALWRLESVKDASIEWEEKEKKK